MVRGFIFVNVCYRVYFIVTQSTRKLTPRYFQENQQVDKKSFIKLIFTCLMHEKISCAER